MAIAETFEEQLKNLEGLSFTQKSLGLFGILFVFHVARNHYRQRKSWVDVPVVGGSGIIGSYIAGLKFISSGRDLIQEGYYKHKPKAFQVAERNHWHIIVTSPEAVDELRKLPEDVLSADIAADEHLKAQYTMGPTIISNPYHVASLKNFNKSLASHFLELVEEMKMAFPIYFPTKLGAGGEPEWVPVKVFAAALPLVCRTANRPLVGEVSRHPDWIKINIKYTMDVVIGAQIISLFPGFLQPFVGRYLTTAPRRRRQAVKVLGPVVEERRRLLEEEGKKGPNIPNDFLTHLLDLADDEERDPAKITLRVLALNVAAIHTSALGLTRTLFLLAAHPQYIAPLREETTRVISEEGWTKTAMNNLQRLDSVIREGLRYHPGAVVNIDRTLLKPYTLADGTHLPVGAFVSVAMGPMMKDPELYGPNAGEFDGFRFAEKRRDEEGEENRNQIVHIGRDFLAFGMGRRACPGRFLAASELKAMLAYILLNYDFKFPDGLYKPGEIPKETWFGTVSGPSDKVEMLFRKRENSL